VSAPAEASSAPATSTTAPPRRRVPRSAFIIAGALAALAYGAGAVKMSLGAPLVILGLGGVAIALFGLALWRVLDPLLGPDGSTGEGPRAPARLRELEREKQAVLKAIREIELDYQMRKIADGDYKEMTQRYRARAMRIIGELDAGEDFRALIEQELKNRMAALRAAGAASVTCPACGNGNESDAVFCKKCGGKLQPAEDSTAKPAT
jgi:hypothetical protein